MGSISINPVATPSFTITTEVTGDERLTASAPGRGKTIVTVDQIIDKAGKVLGTGGGGPSSGYPIVDAKLGLISFEVDDNLNRVEGTEKYGFSEVWEPNTWYNCLNTSDQYESTSLVLTAPPTGGSLYFFTAEYIPCGDPSVDQGMAFMFPMFQEVGTMGVHITYDETSEKPYLVSIELSGTIINCNISSLDINTPINADLTSPGSDQIISFMFKLTSLTNGAKLTYIPSVQKWIYLNWQPNDHEYWTKMCTLGSEIFYLNEIDGMLYSPTDYSYTAYKLLEYIPDDNTSNISTTKEYICNTNVNAMETNIQIIWANEPPTFDGSGVVTLSVVDEVGCFTVK